MIARVIIDNPSSQTDIEYEYQTDESVVPGMRVLVPFGKSDTKTLGIVLSIKENANYLGPIKNIIKVLDEEPILTSNQLTMLEEIKKWAICPKSRILNMMMPQALRLKKESYLRILDSSKIDANLLLLFEGSQIVKYTDKFNNYKEIINKLIKEHAIEKTMLPKEKRVEKYQNYYALVDPTYFAKGLVRQDVINCLKQKNRSEIDLINNYNATKYMLTDLEKRGVISKYKVKVSRIKESYLKVVGELFNQSINYDQFLNHNNKLILFNDMQDEKEFIYQLINNNLNAKVLIVVPEILKGYTIASLINKYFDKRICFLNKTLNENVICEHYLNIKNGEYDIVIATVAFILWDYSSFDTVLVIDEDSAIYKLDQSPRINCIDVLNYLSIKNKQRLILTTYAMSLARYIEVLKNHYELITFPNKNTHEPKLVFYDSLNALRALDTAPIQKQLLEKVHSEVKKGRMVAFILNNKSYAKNLYCLNCGKRIVCPKCGSNLFLQKEKNSIKCPTCFFKADDNKCPKCGSTNIVYSGIGQEQLAEFLKAQGFRTYQLSGNSLQIIDELYDLSDQGDIDCVISSINQFKAIDKALFSLIVFVDFDALTNAPNYNAHLDAMNALMVAKAKGANELAIQTYNATQPVLLRFAKGEIDEFYTDELAFCKELKLKPFYQVDQLLIKADYQEILKIANTIKKTILSLSKDTIIIGPSYNYREQKAQLIVKTKDQNMNNIYLRIYELYQKTNAIIIFDRNSDNYG